MGYPTEPGTLAIALGNAPPKILAMHGFGKWVGSIKARGIITADALMFQAVLADGFLGRRAGERLLHIHRSASLILTVGWLIGPSFDVKLASLKQAA